MRTFWRMLPFVLIISLLQIVLLCTLFFPPKNAQSSSDRRTILQEIQLRKEIANLVRQADWIGRGRVVGSRSHWNQDHTAIESEVQIQVLYTVMGTMAESIVVETMGGYLPTENLGMLASHVATFTPGEELFLFLRKKATHYEVIGQEAGKFNIFKPTTVNDELAISQPMSTLISLITAEVVSAGQSIRLPDQWWTAEPNIQASALLTTQNYVYLNLKWAVNKIKMKININTAQAGGSNGSVEDFRNAMIRAAATWSLVPASDFTILYDGETTTTVPTLNQVNEMMFMHRGAGDAAGQSRLWYTGDRVVVEADVWFNDDMLWDTTGAPARQEIDLQSVALHEFGHWLGLGHDLDTNAVMYSTLTLGTLKRSLYANDREGIAFIYPCTNYPCLPPEYPTPEIATETPTASPTDTATATDTPTSLPSNPPTTTNNAPTVTLIPTTPGNDTPTPTPRGTPEPGQKEYLPMVQR